MKWNSPSTISCWRGVCYSLLGHSLNSTRSVSSVCERHNTACQRKSGAERNMYSADELWPHHTHTDTHLHTRSHSACLQQNYNTAWALFSSFGSAGPVAHQENSWYQIQMLSRPCRWLYATQLCELSLWAPCYYYKSDKFKVHFLAFFSHISGLLQRVQPS